MTDSSARHLWDAVLGRLQLQTPKATFDTWLAGTRGESLTDDTLSVSTRTTFAIAWLEGRTQDLANAAASATAGRQIHVRFVLEGAADSAASPGGASQRGDAERAPNDALWPAATFASFVELPENHLAHAAALAVARAPGSAYNPLYIYGNVGLGKTHLLHAIGHHAHGAGLSVEYVTAEELTNAYLAAMRAKRTKAFRERFWAVDVLLLDDAHTLEGKSARIHEGMLHTIDALRRRGSQIVITSDRPALALAIEERLQSRLAAGLQADLDTPSLDSRAALLSAFAEEAGVPLRPDVVAFLAEGLETNPHVLKGALTRLLALADLTGRSITPHLARQALGAHLSTSSPQLSPEDAIAATARFYGLPLEALLGPRRDRDASAARQTAMHILSTLLGLSPEEIGILLGGRERTTILYGLRRAAERVSSDPTASAAVATIKDSLASSESPQRVSTSA